MIIKHLVSLRRLLVLVMEAGPAQGLLLPLYLGLVVRAQPVPGGLGEVAEDSVGLWIRVETFLFVFVLVELLSESN